MQALILAGGQGTRLRPLTLNTPKPVVPLLNRPFLLFQIDILKLAGITDIILSLNYQPERIKAILGDGADFGVKLTYLVEPQPRGTGGAFGYARDLIKESTVVLNGDILTNLQIAEMAAIHRERKAEATIYLTPVENPAAYGLVETGSDGAVQRFLEKPKAEELAKLTTNNINAGIYILEPGVLNLVPDGESVSFEYQVFPALLAGGKGFYAHIDANAYWRDIGNPRSYLDAHMDFLAGRIEWLAEAPAKTVDYSCDTVSIDAVSVLGENCVMGSNCQIINSVIGPGVRMGDDVMIENSVIWGGTDIGRSALINDAFIGKSCKIGEHAIINYNNVLGDNSSITAFTKI